MFRAFFVPPAVAFPQQHIRGGKHTWALTSLFAFCFRCLQLAKDPATKLFWDSEVLAFADLTQITVNHQEHFIDTVSEVKLTVF